MSLMSDIGAAIKNKLMVNDFASQSSNLLTGGGTISVSAAWEVKWSTRFITISNGKGTGLATNGYFDITMPAAATVITGVGGAANKTVTANGIPVTGWESLYYILPVGGTAATVNANFRVVAYTADVTIPSTWVKICSRNDEGPYIDFACGVSLRNNTSINTNLYDVKGADVDGAVSSASTLATARTIQTNLASTSNASFNGSANITPGVTGTLPVSNGGTGATTLTGLVKGNGTSAMSAAVAGTDYVVPSGSITGNASTATTLQTARTISGVSFNGSADINIEDRLGTAIASAATTTIGTRGLGDYIHITGTTTITSFGTAAAAGVRRTLIFDGALTLTHNATSLICPGAANIVTVAGTIIEVVAETTANWRVVSITHPSLSMAELGYLDGVTSAIQTQLNAKAALASPAFTGTPTVNGYNISPFSGFKNYIINGNFGIWQRGTSFTGLTNGLYSVDRWVVFDSVNDINYNVVRNAGVFTGGYGATYTWNSGTGMRSIIQFIENVTRFKVGSSVTVSFEAYTDSIPYSINVSIQGVRGTWASATSAVSSPIALTNTKTKYSVTLSVPDWTSLGINWAYLEDTKLALKFDFGADTNGKNFIVGNVQLEEGSIATPFENRHYGLELSLCQRYYETEGTARCEEFRNATTGSTQYGAVRFNVQKRGSPTIIVYSDNFNTIHNVTESNGNNIPCSLASIGNTGFRLSWTNTPSAFGASFKYTASAEL